MLTCGNAAGVLGGMEGLLQQLLAAPLPLNPDFLTLHARALECFGRLLAAEPSAVPAVIQRVGRPVPLYPPPLCC